MYKNRRRKELAEEVIDSLTMKEFLAARKKKVGSGGARRGAGRPRKEPTQAIRLPIRLVEQLPRLISLMENKSQIKICAKRIYQIQEGEAVLIEDLEKMGYEILRDSNR